MVTKTFINLPVKDLQASIAFFTTLGFDFDERFTDDKATCMIVSDEVSVMLLTEERFSSFTPKKVCNAEESTEVLIALSVASRDEVEVLVEDAVKAGGSTYSEAQDHGFMYGHGFQDLDGHIWELIFMVEQD